MNSLEQIIKLTAELKDAQKGVAEYQRLKEIEQPKKISDLEQRALSGDEEALKELAVERERLNLMPGVLLQLQRRVEGFKNKIKELGRCIIQGMREDAREKLEKEEEDSIAQMGTRFGGDPARTKKVTAVILENCEAKRWLEKLPRDPTDYGDISEIGPRLVGIRKAFDAGRSLSFAVRETEPNRAEAKTAS